MKSMTGYGETSHLSRGTKINDEVGTVAVPIKKLKRLVREMQNHEKHDGLR